MTASWGTPALPVVDLECKFAYEAAHRLPQVPQDHQCYRMHGHSYKLTVTVRGVVASDGFVADFAVIKSLAKGVIAELDHHLLNDIDGLENPTVERQLTWLWDRLYGRFLERQICLAELHLVETDTNSGRYRAEQG